MIGFLGASEHTASSKQEIAQRGSTWHGAAAANHAHGSLDGHIGGALLLLGIGLCALRSRPGAVLAQRQQPILQLLHNWGLVLDRAIAK